jgi:hypothetical protein
MRACIHTQSAFRSVVNQQGCGSTVSTANVAGADLQRTGVAVLEQGLPWVLGAVLLNPSAGFCCGMVCGLRVL